MMSTSLHKLIKYSHIFVMFDNQNEHRNKTYFGHNIVLLSSNNNYPK